MVDEATHATQRYFDLVSIVGLFDAHESDHGSFVLEATAIEAIEEELNETINVGRASTDSGQGPVLGIRRRQVDMLLVGNRVEVRNLSSQFSLDIATVMSKFLISVISKLEQLHWVNLGYNFILPIVTEVAAIEKLGAELLRKDLSTTLGQRLKGGAAWLWLELEDESTLWLRLEPNRTSSTTKRMIANANFSVPLSEGLQLPPQDHMAEKLLKYSEDLDSILKKMSL